MFKEQYIRDNDKLHAKETLLMEIKEKRTREEKRLTRQEKFVRYGAVAAAFILVIGGVLGVWFANRGTGTATTAQQTLEANTANSSVTIESYDDIYDMVEQMQYGYYEDGMNYDMVVSEEVAAGEASTDEAVMERPQTDVKVATDTATGSSGDTNDYSETNVQVKGVDEAGHCKNRRRIHLLSRRQSIEHYRRKRRKHQTRFYNAA